MNIWTDGGCMENGTADAWGAWAFVSDDGHEESGRLEQTTNNRAELQAIINAVEHAKARGADRVTIHTDSQLCINCATGKWKRKANLDLWRAYADGCTSINVRFVWVRGHSGDANNERCDALCSAAMATTTELDADQAEHMRSIACR